MVISSPRRRALATAEFASLSVDEVSPSIAEWDYGRYEGLTTAQTREFLGQHPTGTLADDLIDQRRRRRRGIGGVVTVGRITDYGEHRDVPSQPALLRGLAWNHHSVTREGTPLPEPIHRFQALLRGARWPSRSGARCRWSNRSKVRLCHGSHCSVS